MNGGLWASEAENLTDLSWQSPGVGVTPHPIRHFHCCHPTSLLFNISRFYLLVCFLLDYSQAFPIGQHIRIRYLLNLLSPTTFPKPVILKASRPVRSLKKKMEA